MGGGPVFLPGIQSTWVLWRDAVTRHLEQENSGWGVLGEEGMGVGGGVFVTLTTLQRGAGGGEDEAERFQGQY